MQQVGVRAQAAEVGLAHNQVVGVYDPDVVAVSPGEGQRLRPVVAEVKPRPFVKLARDAKTGHVVADHVLGPVVGTGVHDYPRADIGRDLIKHFLDDVCLVTDDHVEADRRTHGQRVGHGQIVPRKLPPTWREVIADMAAGITRAAAFGPVCGLFGRRRRWPRRFRRWVAPVASGRATPLL